VFAWIAFHCTSLNSKRQIEQTPSTAFAHLPLLKSTGNAALFADWNAKATM
jgi:hypothetical protein